MRCFGQQKKRVCLRVATFYSQKPDIQDRVFGKGDIISSYKIAEMKGGNSTFQELGKDSAWTLKSDSFIVY